MKKVVAGVLIAAMMLSTAACGKGNGASNYPNKPVTVVVPWSAGGGNDTVIRGLVDCAKDKFPKGIAIENRTGSGGTVGLSYGQNAKADGYTLTNIAVELVTLPHAGTGGDVNYEKFTPIAMVNESCSCITVKADSPYQTLNDLIEAAKTGEIQAGNSGVGAIWHLAAVALEQKAGVKFKHVPFDGGSLMITALLGGHIDFISCSYSEVSSQVKAGELRVLACLADERMAEAPDIPTAKELGYDVSIGAWRGIAVPKDTPAEVVKYLEDTFVEAANSDKFKEFMEKANFPVIVKNSEEFSKMIEEDNVKYKDLIGSLNLAK